MDEALVEKYFRDECTHAEVMKVLEWFRTPEGQAYLNDKIEQDIRVLKEYGAYFDYPELNSEDLFGRIQKSKNTTFEHTKGRRRCSGAGWKKVASIVLLIGIVGLITVLFIQGTEAETKMITSEKGERKTFILPDSSKVILHNGSSLEFVEAFEERKVRLEGEAYFEVQHQERNPFVVFADNFYVKVLGTKFVVRKHADEQRVQVGVKSGRVKLGGMNGTGGTPDILTNTTVNEMPGNKDEPIQITSGEVVSYKQQSPVVRKSADFNKLYSWVGERETESNMNFHESPLRKVVAELEKRYGIECIIEDEELADKKFTSSFDGETLEEVLKVVTLSLDITYREKGDTVYFSK